MNHLLLINKASYLCLCLVFSFFGSYLYHKYIVNKKFKDKVFVLCDVCGENTEGKGQISFLYEEDRVFTSDMECWGKMMHFTARRMNRSRRGTSKAKL